MSTPSNISAPELTEFVAAALRSLGVKPEHAGVAAEVVVEADLRGVDSHGIKGFAARVTDMQQGKIKATAEPTLIRSVGAMASFDGHQGYAPVECPQILKTATALADEHGIGMAFIRDISHWGCPAYYSRWMARQGYYGLSITNTNPAMPLWGSSARSVGNNPIAIAAPRRGHEPIVLDMAMQQIAWGSLKILEDEGRMLEQPWGFDEEGNETRDPGVINRTGRVRPTGDHKGSGMAFMFEILTGVMAAGMINGEIGRKTKEGEPAHYCQTYIAIKPDVFTGKDAYFDKVDQLYDTAKKAPLAKGFDEISLPGDRSNATMAKRRRDGIPTARIWKSIEQIASACSIALPGKVNA